MKADNTGITRRSLLQAGAVLLPGVGVLTNFADAFGRNAPTSPDADPADGGPDYAIIPVPFTRVTVRDEFWAPRMEVNRNVSIWHCFDKLTRPDDFGFSKLIEGAAYMIAKRPDPKLEEHVDTAIDTMLSRMGPRVTSPDQAVHVAGHFLEAAVAYYAATGKRKMLDAALQDGDTIAANYGTSKKTYISQHEGEKIGLVALYRQSGDRKYVQSANFFLDERGKDDYPRTGEYAADRTYAQDHERVVQQKEAVGHAVRATFLYIALTDIAALSGKPEYAKAADAIWQDAVYKKTYLTGSIGSIRFHEQYGAPYELPNLSGWSETCASYGNAVWNHRMFLLHQDAKYIDVMERILYNGFATGVSLKGDRFYYQNPLKSFGSYERFDWINTPCCPPNVVRLMASIGSYIYAQSADSVYVNLFVASDASITVSGDTKVALAQETRYPWDGAVKLSVDPERAATFAMRIRLPGWTRDEVMPGDLYHFADKHGEKPTITLNGRPVSFTVERGYATIVRQWQQGDVLQLTLPMPVRRVVADSRSREIAEMVALQRGPVVYCAEWPDNGDHALNVVIPDSATLGSEWRADLLNGTQVITGAVQAVSRGADGHSLETKPHTLVAVPYHAWANRGMGEMAVWLAKEPAKAWVLPVPPRPIKSVTSSGGIVKAWTGYNDQSDDICAVYDGKDPLSSADESNLYFRMRPEVGSPAWVEYEFEGPTKVSSTKVYWADDRRFCRLPKSWRVLYKDGADWKPVANQQAYDVVKDKFNTVRFDAVTTTAVRLEVEPATTLYKSGSIGPPAAMFISQDTQWREFGLIDWRVS